MTREEAIKALNEYGVLFPSDVDEAIDMAIEALSAEVKGNRPKPDYSYEADMVRRLKEALSADAVQGWIPCSERLPEVGEICLLTVREYGWNCKDYTRVIIGEYSDNYADHILAWMPLPKPYEPKTERRG